MTQYEIRDDSGWRETITAESMDEALELAEEMMQEGDWGDDGAAVDVWVSELDEDGDEVRTETITVDIGPRHDRLIRAAAGSEVDRICGTSPEDHDWTSEGEGGCSENPGVWSTGGTSLVARSHCRRCGLRRTIRVTGSQRNPGEHNTTEYELAD